MEPSTFKTTKLPLLCFIGYVAGLIGIVTGSLVGSSCTGELCAVVPYAISIVIAPAVVIISLSILLHSFFSRKKKGLYISPVHGFLVLITIISLVALPIVGYFVFQTFLSP
jgi:hypothetical protein